MIRPPGSVHPILLSILMLGCGGGDRGGGGQVSGLQPPSVFNDRDTVVQVTGQQLAGTQSVLLWAGTPERLQRQVSVTGLKVGSDTDLAFVAPAGALPGEYMVVLQSPTGTSFSTTRLKISERPGAVRPEVLRVQGQLFSDVPSRIYLVGPGMKAIKAVQVAGEPPVALSHLRAYSAARIGASLDEDQLAPGSYRLRIQGAGGWIDGPEVTVEESGHAADSILCFSIYFGVLGAVFLVGMLLAFREGDIGLGSPAQRRNFVMLMSGLVFTFVLLGSVQLGLSWWR